MKKIIVIIIIFSVFIVTLHSEEQVAKSPWIAGLLSLTVPGGGQLYNGSWAKFGTAVAIEGTLISMVLYHNKKSNDYYNKYENTLDENYYTKYNNNYYKKQNDLWWLGITVFISTLDAFVDAHLYNFEMEKKKIHLMFDGEILSFRYNF